MSFIAQAESAVYQIDDARTIHASIDGWVRALNSNLTKTPALLISVGPPADPILSQYRIDRSGTIINKQDCNHPSTERCRMTLVSFLEAGSLPPIGLAWPLALKADYPDLTGGTNDDGQLLITRSDFYSVTLDADVSTATLTYEVNSNLPSTGIFVTTDGTEIRLSRTSHETTGMLPARPVGSDEGFERESRSGPFRMFAGEASDDFRRGASHLEMLDGLAGASSEAAAQMESGCVVRFNTWYYEKDDPTPVIHLIRPEPSELVVVDVVEGSDATRWRAYRYSEHEPEYQLLDSKPVARSDCPAPERPFLINSSDFVSIFDGFEFRYQIPLNFRYEFHSSPPGNRTGPADWFAMEMVPPYVDLSTNSVGYLPYRFVMSATTGLLEYMYIDPRDAVELQPGP